MKINLLSSDYQKGLLIDFGTFHKIIRISDHLIEEISARQKPLNKGETHIIRAVESLHETEAIDFDILSLIYDGQEDIPGSIFRLLENYLKGDYVLDEADDSPHGLYTRKKVFQNYLKLGKILNKNIDQSLQLPSQRLAITDQTSTRISESLNNIINPKLWDSIIQAFEFDISEIYDKNTLLLLLKEAGIIGERQEWYFRTMSSHIDFVRYLKILLNNNEVFIKSLSSAKLEELENCFYGLDMFSGELTEKQILESNDTRRMILSMCETVVEKIMHGDIDSITHDFLNSILDMIQEYFPYKPFYLRILHAELDEIQELPSMYYKAIQILGILVCDILDSSHSLYEDASEILLCNTRSKNNHSAILRIIQSKENDIEASIPRNVKIYNTNTALMDMEGEVEYQDSQLIIWMRDILNILESGSLFDEGDYVSQFYAFLLQDGFFSQDEFFHLQEAGDGEQNLFGIIEQIFTRNFLGDYPREESEYLDTFLSVINYKGDTHRYERLIARNTK